MLRFQQYLEEGVNDPAIFKAVFLAGGPGSGKSFIVGKTGLTSMGYKVVNSDDAFEARNEESRHGNVARQHLFSKGSGTKG